MNLEPGPGHWTGQGVQNTGQKGFEEQKILGSVQWRGHSRVDLHSIRRWVDAVDAWRREIFSESKCYISRQEFVKEAFARK